MAENAELERRHNQGITLRRMVRRIAFIAFALAGVGLH